MVLTSLTVLVADLVAGSVTALVSVLVTALASDLTPALVSALASDLDASTGAAVVAAAAGGAGVGFTASAASAGAPSRVVAIKATANLRSMGISFGWVHALKGGPGFDDRPNADPAATVTDGG